VIVAATKPGDVVLDPFFGSGTTGAVAKRLGRHWIGLERGQGLHQAGARADRQGAEAETEVLTIQAKREEPRIPFGWLVERGCWQPGRFSKASTAAGAPRCAPTAR
jgi:modification methylase